MKNLFPKLIILSLAVLPALGFSQDQARVVSSTAVMQIATVPQRVCSVSQVMVPDQKSGAGAVMGALAGGAIGNSVGQGGGKAAATVLGLLGGAVAGDRLEEGSAHARSVQNCVTQMTRQSRIAHYNVVYEYAGKHYRVAMANDPGQYVMVQVAPVNALRVPALASQATPAPSAPLVVAQEQPTLAPAPSWLPTAPAPNYPDASQTGFAVIVPPVYYYVQPDYGYWRGRGHGHPQWRN